MAENTKIEWCDHTWNPWVGCTQVSPACDHCYAMEMMDRRYGKVSWGAGEDRARTSANTWNEPHRWERRAAAANRIETVFCLSLGDIWDNEVDPIWRREAFAVMERTPHLIYLLLSKRIGNAVKMCSAFAGLPALPANAALGATMVNQEEWDRDISKLKDAAEHLGARFMFASVEPMLGPIDMRGQLPDWVICGGESGPGARPMHPDWARSLRDQCRVAGVPFFFKQWGEWRAVAPVYGADSIDTDAEEVEIAKAVERRCDFMDRAGRLWGDERCQLPRSSWIMERVGKRRAGAILDGREWREMPA